MRKRSTTDVGQKGCLASAGHPFILCDACGTVAFVFQFGAWVLGFLVGCGVNIPSDAGWGGYWWHGLLFSLALYPSIWILGLIFPHPTLNFAGGATIGGGLPMVLALVNKDWAYITGGAATLIVGYLSAFGQRIRVRG